MMNDSRPLGFGPAQGTTPTPVSWRRSPFSQASKNAPTEEVGGYPVTPIMDYTGRARCPHRAVRGRAGDSLPYLKSPLSCEWYP